MSGMNDQMVLKDDDVKLMLAAGTHIGTTMLDPRMETYVHGKTRNGAVHIFNLKKTWEKLLLAARAIVAVENPKDVIVLTRRPFGQRAVVKFGTYTGCTVIAGRFNPGAFTNHEMKNSYTEPRLLFVVDPSADTQAVFESQYVNLPVIGLCNSDTLLHRIEVAIPCNNKSIKSIGLMMWMLAREVLRMRGTISRQLKWDVMVDLFFHRDRQELEKQQRAQAKEEAQQTQQQPTDLWGTVATQPMAVEPMPTFGAPMPSVQQPMDAQAVAPASENWADASWDPTAASAGGIVEGW